MDQILYLLTQYRYLLLFPLAVIEGPILAVIAGFLCIGGFLNLFLVYPIIVAGDITGDSVCYMFGRLGVPPFVKKIALAIGLKHENINRVKIFFDSNPNKTISLSKITLGIGVAGIYLAGNAKIPYYRFIRICLVTSALQFIVYLGIGLLFGDAYRQISKYMNYFAALTITAGSAIILIYIIKSIRKRI